MSALVDKEDAPISQPFAYWRIWRAADRLEQDGISSATTKAQYRSTTLQVVKILRTWGHKWAGQGAWQSVLNKPSLQHEAEESIVALHHLHEWLQRRRKQPGDSITVVDLCCGKGFYSMLLSYMVGTYWKDLGIGRIVLLDKATKIDWHHIDAANATAEQEGRPHMELWKGVNLHDYDPLLDRLLQLPQPLALVGIHLCKNLSPTAIGLAQGLGGTSCPYFLLAPCCLPRVVTSRYIDDSKRTIPIYQYETPANRVARQRSVAQRDRAQGRDRRGKCYICGTVGHRVRECPSLEGLPDEECKARLKEATLKIPCWTCGEVGHFKADCPAKEIKMATSSALEPPVRCWSVASIPSSRQPFGQYCQVLADTMEEEYTVKLHDTGLENTKTTQHHDKDSGNSQKGNWNADRKSIYIVATKG